MTSPQGDQILQLESELQQVRDQGAMTGGAGSYPGGNASSSTSGSPAMTAASPVASSGPTSPVSAASSMSATPPPSSTSTSGQGTIPSVMGDTFSQAQSKIQQAGFSANPSGNTASGKVFSQTPQAGGVFPKGGTVDIALK